MRRKLLSAVVGFATLAAVLAFVPQETQARDGYRGAYGGYGYGYRGRVYRPYSVYRPYRYDGYYRYPRAYPPRYYYYPPTYGPSPYGYPGMVPPAVQINPGVYYRF